MWTFKCSSKYFNSGSVLCVVLSFPFPLPFSCSTAAFRPILSCPAPPRPESKWRAINGSKKSNKKLGQSIASLGKREKALPKTTFLIKNVRPRRLGWLKKVHFCPALATGLRESSCSWGICTIICSLHPGFPRDGSYTQDRSMRRGLSTHGKETWRKSTERGRRIMQIARA